MSIIVWVYGSSAAGKETFIHKMMSNPPQKVIDYLGWKNKKIIFIEESVKYIGKFENDPVIHKRQEIIEKAIDASKKSNIVILIKGQDVDLKTDLLGVLKKRIPNANHRIIFLHAGFELMYARCQKKDWWSKDLEKAGIDGFKDWLINDQLKYLLELRGIDIVALDSSDYNYRPIKFPLEIK